MASTRWPPKSCAACSICSFARRSAPRASRISGCRSAGVAAGVAGSALAAGAVGTLALFGAADAVAINANARIKVARASRPTILVFMNHSSRPTFGSDRRIVPLFPICMPVACYCGYSAIGVCRDRGVQETSKLPCDLTLPFLGRLHGDEKNIFVRCYHEGTLFFSPFILSRLPPALGQNFVLAKYNIVCYICYASLLSAWYVQEGGTVYDRPRFTGCARKKRMDAGRNGGKAGGHPGLSFDAGEWPPLDAF